jgi:hypothetical protein
MESRLQQGNPLYLPCCEDRIRFRKNARLQLWSMSIKPPGIGYKDELGRLTSHRRAKRDISWLLACVDQL